MDNKLNILNYLAKNISEFTMHQLAVKLDMPYATFYRTVSGMNDLLSVRQVGRAKAVSLNWQNPVISSYLAVSSYEEKKKFLGKKPLARILDNSIGTDDIVVMFGSYAKQKETKKSDIDIMVINRSGKKSVNFSEFMLVHRKKVNPIYLKTGEFSTMLKDSSENVVKQALKAHIVLNNPQGFWNLVSDAVRQKGLWGIVS